MAGNESVTNKSWKIALGEQESCYGAIFINFIGQKFPGSITNQGLNKIKQKAIEQMFGGGGKGKDALSKLQGVIRDGKLDSLDAVVNANDKGESLAKFLDVKDLDAEKLQNNLKALKSASDKTSGNKTLDSFTNDSTAYPALTALLLIAQAAKTAIDANKLQGLLNIINGSDPEAVNIRFCAGAADADADTDADAGGADTDADTDAGAGGADTDADTDAAALQASGAKGQNLAQPLTGTGAEAGAEAGAGTPTTDR